MKLVNSLVLAFVLGATTAQTNTNILADKVIIDKSKRVLLLINDESVSHVFRITLGGNPVGHKVMEGDKKTPEGSYKLDYKNPNSKFYRSIHVSYPNTQDREIAKELGVSPGGAIMIHGQRNGSNFTQSLINQYRDWTAGCISVSNHDMDEIWSMIQPGTPIEINP